MAAFGPGMFHSALDVGFRRVLLLSKLFTKSWGHPDTLTILAKHMNTIMSKRQITAMVQDLNGPEVIIEEENVKKTHRELKARFKSPHAMVCPSTMPSPVDMAHFRAFLPKEPAPVCFHMPGTGDHSYKRREYLLVEDLLKDGVGGVLLQNPFYGERKPPGQFRSSLENVSDLFVMGAAIISEINFLIQWLKQRGYGPFAISGVSMGGFTAQLAATNIIEPVATVPILAWTTSSPAYTSGAIAPAINYPRLQQQLEDANYVNKLERIPDVDWIPMMHEMSESNGQPTAYNLMRILMDHFTSIHNYPPLTDPTLCHVFLAENDKYVLRGDDSRTYEQCWPGSTVEYMNDVSHVSAYLMNHYMWRKRISHLLNQMKA